MFKIEKGSLARRENDDWTLKAWIKIDREIIKEIHVFISYKYLRTQTLLSEDKEEDIYNFLSNEIDIIFNIFKSDSEKFLGNNDPIIKTFYTESKEGLGLSNFIENN